MDLGILVGQQDDDVYARTFSLAQGVCQGAEGRLEVVGLAVDAGNANAKELVEFRLGARLNLGLRNGSLEVCLHLDLADGRIATSVSTARSEEDGRRVIGGVDKAPEDGAEPDGPKARVGTRQAHFSINRDGKALFPGCDLPNLLLVDRTS
jgi:hypothetical protein